PQRPRRQGDGRLGTARWDCRRSRRLRRDRRRVGRGFGRQVGHGGGPGSPYPRASDPDRRRRGGSDSRVAVARRMTLRIEPVEGIGEIEPGDDLATMLAEALRPMSPSDADVLVVTHKVVSKAEGAIVELDDDGPDAHRELVESEAVRILRRRGNLVIAETRHGFVCANAGVDRSNTRPGTAILLPEDPDRSARRIRDRLGGVLGIRPAVIISDTFGRPWRRGLVDVAIGVAGMHPIEDLRGTSDSFGRVL